MDHQSMPPLLVSPEAPQDEVEIRQGEAVTINEALALAHQETFHIGKSTLQRWAKIWNDLGTTAPVKSVLITNRHGSAYRLDRSDFLSWVFDEKENDRSRKISPDLMRPQEVQGNPERHQEVSQDLSGISEEVDELQSKLEAVEEEKAEIAGKFEDETVLRKFHEYRAARAEEAIDGERDRTDRLLKLVGAQEHKLRELGMPEMDILRLSQPSPAPVPDKAIEHHQSPQESHEHTGSSI